MNPDPDPCGTSRTVRLNGLMLRVSVVMNATDGEAALNTAIVDFSESIRSPRGVIGRGFPLGP